jgi:hypothetical protein
MGMFDYVKCEYPFPEGSPKTAQNDIYQTYDTPTQWMETYVITAEGRLIHQSVTYETVPENERPYWGKPEWKEGALCQLAGSIRSVSTGDVDTNYHGDIYLIGGQPPKFYEFVVRFTNGQLQYIRMIGEPKSQP